MKKQSTADLQEDYLLAIGLTAERVAPQAPARATELLSQYAAELSRQSGVEFTELRDFARII